VARAAPGGRIAGVRSYDSLGTKPSGIFRYLVIAELLFLAAVWFFGFEEKKKRSDARVQEDPGRGSVDLVREILLVHVGSDHKLTLGAIRRKLQLQDPGYKAVVTGTIRAIIEDLREEGIPICNDRDGRGYYVASGPQEYQDFRAVYYSSALTILARIRAMDKTVEKEFGASALQDKLF